MNGVYRSDQGRDAVHRQYEAMLSTWPIPAERHRLPTCQGETFVLTCGHVDAPPLVLLQGSGANIAMWARDITTLAQHHRVYAVDVIGEPGFSAASRPELASDAHARWLDDVMDAVGLHAASFAGVSLGGWLVLDYAIRRPHRVTKAIVISPSGIGRQRAGFLPKIMMLMLLGAWGRRRAVAFALGPSPGRPHPADRHIGALAMTIGRHFRRRHVRIPRFTDEQLRALTMPLLAIVGAQDAMLDSAETKRRLARLAPGALVHLLPDVGHLVRDRADAVVDFLGA